MKHTPWPWEVDGDTVWAGNVRVAECESSSVGKEQAEANARLIAQAPALHQALLAVLPYARQANKDHECPWLCLQCQAIAEAERVLEQTGGE